MKSITNGLKQAKYSYGLVKEKKPIDARWKGNIINIGVHIIEKNDKILSSLEGKRFKIPLYNKKARLFTNLCHPPPIYTKVYESNVENFY